MRKHKNTILFVISWGLFIGLLLFSIIQLQQDSKIVNYTGIVRGGTQRLVKLELSGQPNDPLIESLDQILEELHTGNGPHHISKSHDLAFTEKLQDLSAMWKDLKRDIEAVRSTGGTLERAALLQKSEAYFTLANETVFAAEQSSEYKLTFSLLLTALLTFVVFYGLMHLNKRQNAKLNHLLYTDPLTGIANQSAFADRALYLLRDNPSISYALVYFDINNFKYVNDAYGYETGDALLQAIAQYFDRHLSKNELCARINADHFALLTFNGEERDISLTNRIRVCIDQAASDGIELNIADSLSYSFGIYQIVDHAEPVNSIMDKANIALKQAKNHEEMRTVSYNDALFAKLQRERQIEARMQSALQNAEFLVYLQPKVEISTNTMIGAESLVRWVSPEFGFLPPDEFIPLFEKNGFIAQLDFYVLDRVCRKMRQVIDDRLSDSFSISINLSRVTLYQDDFFERFTRIVERYKMPPSRIELEVTESAFIGNQEGILSVLERLKGMGFLIAMDDFGSGYSSLNLLKLLPIDVLKIDKQFLRESSKGDRSYRIIKCVIEMAKALDAQVVCEGVETKEQVDFLAQINCDIGQGYYFARPMAIADFEVAYNLH